MGAKCRPEHRHQDAKVRYSLGASVLCEQSTATRSSAAGSLPLRKPAVGTSPPARLLRSRSSVRLRRGYTCLLFLHTSAGKNPAGSVPGRQEAALRPAGADSVGIPLRCTRHRLRRGHSARPDGREPSTFDPGMGRSVPDPGGSLPTHSAGLFRCSREPCVSLPRRSIARRPPRCQTPSGATLHFVPRPWLLGDSKPGCRPDGIKNGNDITRITDPP